LNFKKLTIKKILIVTSPSYYVCICRLQKDVFYDYDLEDELKKRDDEKRKQQTRQS